MPACLACPTTLTLSDVSGARCPYCSGALPTGNCVPILVDLLQVLRSDDDTDLFPSDVCGAGDSSCGFAVGLDAIAPVRVTVQPARGPRCFASSALICSMDLAIVVDGTDPHPGPEPLRAGAEDRPATMTDGSVALRRRLQLSPSSSSLFKLAASAIVGDSSDVSSLAAGVGNGPARAGEKSLYERVEVGMNHIEVTSWSVSHSSSPGAPRRRHGTPKATSPGRACGPQSSSGRRRPPQRRPRHRNSRICRLSTASIRTVPGPRKSPRTTNTASPGTGSPRRAPRFLGCSTMTCIVVDPGTVPAASVEQRCITERIGCCYSLVLPDGVDERTDRDLGLVTTEPPTCPGRRTTERTFGTLCGLANALRRNVSYRRLGRCARSNTAVTIQV